jgi:hypothetical protein
MKASMRVWEYGIWELKNICLSKLNSQLLKKLTADLTLVLFPTPILPYSHTPILVLSFLPNSRTFAQHNGFSGSIINDG